VGDSVTDEIFGISVHQSGCLNPWYSFGAVACAAPLWALGTSFGILAGNILPLRLVSALSVALFGMFLAVFIPPARKSRIIAFLVAVSFVLSWLLGQIPVVRDIADGTRTILLTVVTSAAAAVLFPRTGEEDEA
jgi:predicted branched-subunit amino acid permease